MPETVEVEGEEGERVITRSWDQLMDHAEEMTRLRSSISCRFLSTFN